MKIHHIPTHKHGERKGGLPPRLLIIHSTDMPTAESLEMLTTNPREVSCHYLITPEGQIYQMVDESRRAWHAGAGSWLGVDDVNSQSIGIELVWPADRLAYENEVIAGFPPAQMDALLLLAKEICTRHHIPPYLVLAHSDVSVGRKRDPGENFNWPQLAAAGLALWYSLPLPTPYEGDLHQGLQKFGYDTTQPDAALMAFQRHFQPQQMGKGANEETRQILAALLAQSPSSHQGG